MIVRAPLRAGSSLFDSSAKSGTRGLLVYGVNFDGNGILLLFNLLEINEAVNMPVAITQYVFTAQLL